mgnify:CR=1 FL=1
MLRATTRFLVQSFEKRVLLRGYASSGSSNGDDDANDVNNRNNKKRKLRDLSMNARKKLTEITEKSQLLDGGATQKKVMTPLRPEGQRMPSRSEPKNPWEVLKYDLTADPYDMVPRVTDILIVGGGVIGWSCAYFLHARCHCSQCRWYSPAVFRAREHSDVTLRCRIPEEYQGASLCPRFRPSRRQFHSAWLFSAEFKGGF